MFKFHQSAPKPPAPKLFPHTARIRFSVGMPYHLPSEIIRNDIFLNTLKEMSADIHDINFTCKIRPFMRDAYGVIMSPQQAYVHLRDMLYVQEKTGITVSALFNNIYVPPTRENMTLFIENFRPLYELGIRSATIPHTLWMKWGAIQTAFPDLFIKNTVLREVRSGQDFWNAALAGYDYVNLHRIVSRDRPVLREIRRAQKAFEQNYGKRVLISLLNGEGCLGNCPFWVEHYQHTLQHPDAEDPDKARAIFHVPIEVGCMKNGDMGMFPMRFCAVNLSPFREDFEEIAEFVDVIKVGSRINRDDFTRVLGLIKHIKERTQLDADSAPPEPDVQGTPEQQAVLRKWRTAIRTCRFQCWDCSLCADVQLILGGDIRM